MIRRWQVHWFNSHAERKPPLVHHCYLPSASSNLQKVCTIIVRWIVDLQVVVAIVFITYIDLNKKSRDRLIYFCVDLLVLESRCIYCYRAWKNIYMIVLECSRAIATTNARDNTLVTFFCLNDMDKWSTCGVFIVRASPQLREYPSSLLHRRICLRMIGFIHCLLRSIAIKLDSKIPRINNYTNTHLVNHSACFKLSLYFHRALKKKKKRITWSSQQTRDARVSIHARRFCFCSTNFSASSDWHPSKNLAFLFFALPLLQIQPTLSLFFFPSILSYRLYILKIRFVKSLVHPQLYLFFWWKCLLTL